MSTEGLKRQTRSYLNDNVPQIQEHGGTVEVHEVDEATGRVKVAIGGACSGCGIAPMTMKAIENQLPAEVDDLSDVEVVRSDGPRAAVMPSKTDAMDGMDEYEDYSPPF